MTKRRLDTFYVLLGLLLLWQIASVAVGGGLLTPPLETVLRGLALLSTHTFWLQALSTGQTLLIACIVVVILGLALGCLIGASRLASEVVEPILAPLYAIPKIALYPIILLIFGLSPTATIVFAALHGIFPVMIFTIGGIRKIRPIYFQTARVMRLGTLHTISGVLIPAALPEIVAGLRVGFATTLFGALIAELFASTGGIGFMLIRATDAHNMTDVLAITLLLFVFAVCTNGLISLVESRVRHGRT